MNAAQSVEPELIQRHCDELIARNLPRKVTISEDQFREVGFGDLKPYGCGGTHVAMTAELRGLQVLSARSKKGKVRVDYQMP